MLATGLPNLESSESKFPNLAIQLASHRGKRRGFGAARLHMAQSPVHSHIAGGEAYCFKPRSCYSSEYCATLLNCALTLYPLGHIRPRTFQSRVITSHMPEEKFSGPFYNGPAQFIRVRRKSPPFRAEIYGVAVRQIFC